MEKSSSIGSNWFEWLEFLEIWQLWNQDMQKTFQEKLEEAPANALLFFFWSGKMHKNAMMLIQESYHESIVPVSSPIFAL